jgi:RPA family protein
MNDQNEQREMTFGEKAVGLTFNPSNDDAVAKCKAEFAAVIDRMNNLRNSPSSNPEIARMCSIAITEAQTAQMWAVKAITWKF